MTYTPSISIALYRLTFRNSFLSQAGSLMVHSDWRELVWIHQRLDLALLKILRTEEFVWNKGNWELIFAARRHNVLVAKKRWLQKSLENCGKTFNSVLFNLISDATYKSCGIIPNFSIIRSRFAINGSGLYYGNVLLYNLHYIRGKIDLKCLSQVSYLSAEEWLLIEDASCSHIFLKSKPRHCLYSLTCITSS